MSIESEAIIISGIKARSELKKIFEDATFLFQVFQDYSSEI